MFKRRTYKVIGRARCNENSTGPPCTGFVEMMAPVFSRAAWRCTWHMIQVFHMFELIMLQTHEDHQHLDT
jgi:hypothetical protein